MEIKITYQACDGFVCRKAFKTLAGAQRYAQRMIGRHPEIGCGYAVSGDGIGTIRVQGATLAEIFPTEDAANEAAFDEETKMLNGYEPRDGFWY
jgi:hypothetical protein